MVFPDWLGYGLWYGAAFALVISAIVATKNVTPQSQRAFRISLAFMFGFASVPMVGPGGGALIPIAWWLCHPSLMSIQSVFWSLVALYILAIFITPFVFGGLWLVHELTRPKKRRRIG